MREREHKPLKRPVVAALGGVGFGNGSRVVHYQDKLISKTSARVGIAVRREALFER